jgi:hypothetical protein
MMPAVYEDFIEWTSGKELEKEIEARFPLYVVDGVFQEGNCSTDDDYWVNRKGVLPSLEITAYDVLEALLWADVVNYSFDDYYAEDDEFIITLDEIVEAIAEHNKSPSSQWFNPLSLCRFYLDECEHAPKGNEPDVLAENYIHHLMHALKIGY